MLLILEFIMTFSLEEFCKIVVGNAFQVVIDLKPSEEEFIKELFPATQMETGIPFTKYASLRLPFLCKLLYGKNGSAPFEFVSCRADFATESVPYLQLKNGKTIFNEEDISGMVSCILREYGGNLKREIVKRNLWEFVSI